MALRDLLMDPNVIDVDVDSVDRVAKHRQLLLNKRMIREVFFELYALLGEMDRRFFDARSGRRIEIGSGSSLIKEAMPDVELTDIVDYPGLDGVVDAMSMPYENGAIKTVFGIHCFHHLPDPYKFLSEIDRVCQVGGGTILVEPYYGPVASFIFKRLFANEYFDKNGAAIVENHGPMSDANQALSYIVFERDKDRLRKECPNLEVVFSEPIGNYLRYLISGGVNFRQLLPNASIPALRFFETALQPLRNILALHQIIVVKKIR